MTSPIGLINPVTPIPYNYKTIIASQTTVILGGTGNQGDLLYTLLVVPATTSPGSAGSSGWKNRAAPRRRPS